MIAIDNKLVSDELVEEQFVCDLVKCKGGCCVDGDAGAPLEESEKHRIDEVFEAVKPYLPKHHLAEIVVLQIFVAHINATTKFRKFNIDPPWVFGRTVEEGSIFHHFGIHRNFELVGIARHIKQLVFFFRERNFKISPRLGSKS